MRLAVSGLVLAAAIGTPALATSGAFVDRTVAAPDAFRVEIEPRVDAAQRVQLAQSQEAAQLAVRIQQLEEQIRVLTGQVEGLQFQLTQMQTLIERQTEDNEFRFQQLEGGAPAPGGAGGKTDAAAQPGGVTPSGELPQDPNASTAAPAIPGQDAPLEQPTIPADPNAVPAEGVLPEPGEVEIDPTFEQGPTGAIGTSLDPLLGTGQEGAVPLGTLSPSELDNLGRKPIEQGVNTPASSADADANAQYAAGYEAIVRGDFAFAEEQFRQFIELYPDNAQAADATNWLGEALIQRGSYEEAADILLTGFQNYPDSPRSPDLLLKLGIALAGAGEQETACRTFDEVGKRYTGLAPAFLNRLGDERARAQCPG